MCHLTQYAFACGHEATSEILDKPCLKKCVENDIANQLSAWRHKTDCEPQEVGHVDVEWLSVSCRACSNRFNYRNNLSFSELPGAETLIWTIPTIKRRRCGLQENFKFTITTDSDSSRSEVMESPRGTRSPSLPTRLRPSESSKQSSSRKIIVEAGKRLKTKFSDILYIEVLPGKINDKTDSKSTTPSNEQTTPIPKSKTPTPSGNIPHKKTSNTLSSIITPSIPNPTTPIRKQKPTPILHPKNTVITTNTTPSRQTSTAEPFESPKLKIKKSPSYRIFMRSLGRIAIPSPLQIIKRGY